MALLLLAATALLLSLVALALYLTRNRGTLEKLGIPVDRPFLVFGSQPHAIHEVGHDYWNGKFARFGRTYGRYEGVTPVITTKDPEICRNVFVKHFDCFPTSFELPCMTDKQATLDVITGDRWKNMRRGLSPNFSSGKLKKMMEPMAGVADRFMAHVDRMAASGEGGGRPLALKKPIQGLALDTIATCGFGIQTDAISDPNQEIIKQVRIVLAGCSVYPQHMISRAVPPSRPSPLATGLRLSPSRSPSRTCTS